MPLLKMIIRKKAVLWETLVLTSGGQSSMKTAFAFSPGPDNTQFSEFSHDTQGGPSPGLSSPHVPSTSHWVGLNKCWGDLIPISCFFLSPECDVGASKAVVNGLAPGSNGQDKGKAFKGKPGLVLGSVSRRGRMLGRDHLPSGNSHGPIRPFTGDLFPTLSF